MNINIQSVFILIDSINIIINIKSNKVDEIFLNQSYNSHSQFCSCACVACTVPPSVQQRTVATKHRNTHITRLLYNRIDLCVHRVHLED